MKALILICLFSILISCQEQRRYEVVGNWYYLDSDSAYNELYFSEELFVYNLEGAILGGVYFYTKHNDSIYLHPNFKNPENEFLFKVISTSSDEINLINKKGEEVILYPIEEELNIWNNINLGEKKNLELKEGWFQRNNLLKHGSTENMSDFLTVPPVEQYEGDTIVH